jgi:DNA-directed RNA polymerase beta subunit
MYAYIDRKKKLPVTTLFRAIGFERDKDILEIFDLAEEIKVSKTGLKKYIGRKLAARVLNTWHEDFVDEDSGEVVSIERNEIILDRDTIIDKDNVEEIIDSNVKSILLHKEDANQGDYAIIHNTLQKDPTNSEKEAVEHIYRQLRNAEPPDEETARGIIDKLFFSDQRYNLGEVGRYRMNKKLGLDIPMEKQVLTKEDIITIVKYLIELINAKADIDDIDHLSNRRVRTVGEQLSQQFGVGLARMARTIRERMNVRDNEVFTPIDLINAKTLSSVINSFFGTNSGGQNTTGSTNSYFGQNSGLNNTTGSNNVFIGFDAARRIAAGTNLTIATLSVFLGRDTRANADNQTNQIVIGDSAIGLGSNTTVLGNTSTTFGRWYGSLLLGTTTNAASSILTMESTTQGFLPPRMTTTQRNAIASPATGLIIYNSTDNLVQAYNGTSWINL